jgi:hypothetical protein
MAFTSSTCVSPAASRSMPNAADRIRAAVDHVLATGGADGPETARLRAVPEN